MSSEDATDSAKVEASVENGVEGQQTKDDSNPKESVADVVATPSPAERIRVDWYQTESDVVINILAKGIKKEDVNVEYQSKKILIKFAMPTGEMYERTLNLFKEFNLDTCSMKVMSTKIEIRLKKLDASSWTSLEAVAAPTEIIPTYPSSSKHKKDWAKIDKELSKQKDDDQDVNSLFAKIFEGGDDNTKKAMIKSMQESGGTVLSTNWEEVGKKKVEISPPDGMEYRKWDESGAQKETEKEKV